MSIVAGDTQDHARPEIAFEPIPVSAALPIRLVAARALRPQPTPSLQAHALIEIGRCLNGQGLYEIGGRSVRVLAGEVVIIGRGVPHRGYALGGASHWQWIQFDPLGLLAPLGPEALRLAALPLAGADFPHCFSPDRNDQVPRLTSALAEAIPRHNDLEIRALAAALLAHLEALGAGSGQGADLEALGRIQPALRLIEERFADPLTVESLAQACHTSTSNCWRLFQRALGCSPQAQLTRVRVQQGAVLLAAGQHSVAAVARMVGFAAASSFTRHFHHVFATTPDCWRRAASG